jgi:hypothetical protein
MTVATLLQIMTGFVVGYLLAEIIRDQMDP